VAVILVTGATGNVGAPLVDHLRAAGVAVRSGCRNPRGAGSVRFDFRDASTWPAAFAGVEVMFLIRPPDLTAADLLPALTAGRATGLRHVVLLSVQGAGRVPILPHARLERWLRGSGLGWTIIRPSYFDQNLSTVFAADIRDRDVIAVPAGRGRTAFVDTHDVAAVSVAALLDPPAHRRRVWTPTGPARTYDEVAAILTAELGRPIRYLRPGIATYARHARRQLRMPPSMIAITTVLHGTARVGLAAFETDDVRTVTGRAPATFAEFAHRERAAWMRG